MLTSNEINREAVVLAGGFGTRLASAVAGTPKSMALVAGRPFLRFVLDLLSENSFNHVVIADGYLKEQIENYFGHTYRGLRIDYSSEDEPLGTGGAIKKAFSLCQKTKVFVLNGDTFFQVDFTLLEQAMTQEACAVIASKRMREFNRYGTIEVDKTNCVQRFYDKHPCEDGLINGGVYLMRRDALLDMPQRFSLETEWFEAAVSRGDLFAVECEGDFIDIGIPEDYEFAQEYLASKIQKWKLAIFDRDGTINEDVGHLHNPDDLVLIDEIVEIIREYNCRNGWKVVVATNQAGIAKGMYTESDLYKVSNRLQKMLAERGAQIDAVYFCPHHPDFTGTCDCRKPSPGMLLRAIRDYDADPLECVMYGDQEKDVQAAEAAGVRGVLV